ncbi:hypothetical protein DERF_001360 [Dermatophagoides farinae]|uniref:Uncharacterized protein n=1 Tax=Dermatophagoides farinae TaxID=6954 RepID=A0A922IAQ0_DERFA|nr:hypothetical protein DERF_001360 [Dermatophagoides farinae]
MINFFIFYLFNNKFKTSTSQIIVTILPILAGIVCVGVTQLGTSAMKKIINEKTHKKNYIEHYYYYYDDDDCPKIDQR